MSREEKNEPAVVEESTSIRNSVNTFDFILNTYKRSVEAPPQSEAPPQKQTGRYSLRSKGPISK